MGSKRVRRVPCRVQNRHIILVAADLARLLVASGLVPEIASPDAVHIALASVHQIDFLVTWNFKHIANPHIRERMRTKINDSGHRMPVMCSPEELLNEDETN